MTTQFWGIAGLPVHNLPTEIVTSPERLLPRRISFLPRMVDVALAGLDRGEIVTIPSLPDKAERARPRAVLCPGGF
jgi:hypothetical protein